MWCSVLRGILARCFSRWISGPISFVFRRSFKPTVVGVPTRPPCADLAGLFCPLAVGIACLSRS